MEIIEWRLICKNTKFQVGDAHLGSNPLVLQLQSCVFCEEASKVTSNQQNNTYVIL